MAELTGKQIHVLAVLKNLRPHLTKQQYLTLRGQALAGDTDGAVRGLAKILARKRESK
jgi:hypothetical protein